MNKSEIKFLVLKEVKESNLSSLAKAFLTEILDSETGDLRVPETIVREPQRGVQMREGGEKLRFDTPVPKKVVSIVGKTNHQVTINRVEDAVKIVQGRKHRIRFNRLCDQLKMNKNSMGVKSVLLSLLKLDKRVVITKEGHNNYLLPSKGGATPATDKVVLTKTQKKHAVVTQKIEKIISIVLKAKKPIKLGKVFNQVKVGKGGHHIKMVKLLAMDARVRLEQKHGKKGQYTIMPVDFDNHPVVGMHKFRSPYHEFISIKTKQYIASGMNRTDAFSSAQADWAKIRKGKQQNVGEKKPVFVPQTPATTGKFPAFESIGEQYQPIIIGVMRTCIKGNPITYPNVSYALDLRSDADYKRFVDDILVNALAIKKYFGADGNFHYDGVRVSFR